MKPYSMMNFKNLKDNLKELKKWKKNIKPKDPLRGLNGELARKVSAGLAGHRSGNLTEEEIKTIERIQKEYDEKYKG
jgi:hypothetical protein